MAITLSGYTFELFWPFDEVRIVLPLESNKLTIWPEGEQTRAEWVLGHPLELRPFAWDYLDISCDPQTLTIQPHYEKSSWDTFCIDPTGEVRVTALGGLFPWTLGRQPELLEGIVSVLCVLPARIRGSHDETAERIERTAQHLKRVLELLRSHRIPMSSGFDAEATNPRLRDRLVARFWRWKLT